MLGAQSGLPTNRGCDMDGDNSDSDKGTEASGRTRRAILLGGAAGLAGLAAESLISAQPASATEGNPVNLGEDNGGATARTGVFYTGNTVLAVLADGVNHYGVQAQDNSHGGGIAVLAQSVNGTGCQGHDHSRRPNRRVGQRHQLRRLRR
jgi:hypothetical protein